MIKKIIIATNNKNKFIEFKEILAKVNIEAIPLSDVYNLESVENGISFEENAKNKAKYIFEKTNYVVMSDDSGLAIESLNGMPGIFSARFAYNGYDEAFKQLENIMANVKNKKATFVSCLCLYAGENKYAIYNGVLKGNLRFPAKGIYGFGYDAIFVPENCDKTMAELSLEEKNKISHRKQAFDKLLLNIDKINAYFN